MALPSFLTEFAVNQCGEQPKRKLITLHKDIVCCQLGSWSPSWSLTCCKGAECPELGVQRCLWGWDSILKAGLNCSGNKLKSDAINPGNVIPPAVISISHWPYKVSWQLYRHTRAYKPLCDFYSSRYRGFTPSSGHHSRHVHHWVTCTVQTLSARQFLGCLEGLSQVHSTLQAKQILVSLKEVVCCKGYSQKKCVPIFLITMWLKQEFF